MTTITFLTIITIAVLPAMFLLALLYVYSTLRFHRDHKYAWTDAYENIADDTELRKTYVCYANSHARQQSYATLVFVVLCITGGFVVVTVFDHIWNM